MSSHRVLIARVGAGAIALVAVAGLAACSPSAKKAAAPAIQAAAAPQSGYLGDAYVTVASVAPATITTPPSASPTASTLSGESSAAFMLTGKLSSIEEKAICASSKLLGGGAVMTSCSWSVDKNGNSVGQITFAVRGSSTELVLTIKDTHGSLSFTWKTTKTPAP